MTIRDKLLLHKDYIVKEYYNNKSTVVLGKEFQCNPGTIWYFLNDMNVEIKQRSKYYGKAEQLFTDDILKRFDNGESICYITSCLPISIDTITRILRKNNRDTSRGNCVDYDNLLVDKFDIVRTMYQSGKSCNYIAQQLGYSSASIWNLLNDNHLIDSKRKYKYDVDESFFKTIDTPNKAYILGMWYSDGNVMSSGKIRVCLQANDKDILEKISDVMKYNGPLYYKKSRNKNCKPQVELGIDRKILSDQLINLGCVPCKSLILTFPSNDIVPDCLLCHFVRGYFDGDGSIQNRGYQVSFVGSLMFIKELQCKIKDIFGIQSTLYQRYKDRDPKMSSHQLCVFKKGNVDILLRWMYPQDVGLYMERKYCVVQNLLKNVESV